MFGFGVPGDKFKLCKVFVVDQDLRCVVFGRVFHILVTSKKVCHLCILVHWSALHQVHLAKRETQREKLTSA